MAIRLYVLQSAFRLCVNVLSQTACLWEQLLNRHTRGLSRRSIVDNEGCRMRLTDFLVELLLLLYPLLEVVNVSIDRLDGLLDPTRLVTGAL